MAEHIIPEIVGHTWHLWIEDGHASIYCGDPAHTGQPCTDRYAGFRQTAATLAAVPLYMNAVPITLRIITDPMAADWGPDTVDATLIATPKGGGVDA
jgi:hypothetical protein